MPNSYPTHDDNTVDGLLRQIQWSRFDSAKDGQMPFADDPISALVAAQLRLHGESIHASGGLDAIDETILRITEMNSGYSDQRYSLLEALWSPIGRA